MGFKEFINKYYNNPDEDLYKLIKYWFVFGFIFIGLSIWYLYSLNMILNDFIQKENIYRTDCSYSIMLMESDNDSYASYYRNKIVIIPKYVYFLLFFLAISFLYNLESFLILFNKYRNLRRAKHENNIIPWFQRDR